jgi:hypothetical protein
MFTADHIEFLGYVNAKRGSLAQWKSVDDVTAQVTFSYQKGFTARELKGTIYSGAREPVITFARQEHGWGSDGFLFAASSSFEIYVEHSKGEFRIMYNREWLGRTTQMGHLVKVDETVIGQAYHPYDDTVSFGDLVHVRKSSRSYPFYINNRVLADIMVFSPGGDTLLSINENGIGQRIVRLYDEPRVEEEKWLIVYAILEVVFHGYDMMGE